MEQQHEYQELDFLYDKKVKCPLCEQSTDLRLVKRSSLRLVSKDSDSMPTFKYINPLFYDVSECNHCGYAALAGYFEHVIPDNKKIILKQRVAARWNSRDFPSVYGIGMALNRYKLALYCTELREGAKTESTLLYLKMGWIYRLQSNKEMETRCLTQALEGFIELYEFGDFPVAGMDELSLIYLIADLFNRTGDNRQSLFWLGKVLTDREAKPDLKDKARDLKYRISEEDKISSAV